VEHGGSEGTRDRGLVESALASARNTFLYGGGDLFDVAATYAFHLAESQAFIDGNKRTAVVAAMVFLARNGVYGQPPSWGLYNAMIEVAEKRKSKADLAEIFRQAGRTDI
jgi:death-on-curing protein